MISNTVSTKALVLLIMLIVSVLGYGAEDNKIFIYANKKKYFDKGKYWVLSGNPMIKSGKDTIKADSIKYFSKEKKVFTKGNVRLFDYKNSIEIFGKEGEYFTDSKYAKLVTNTKLIAIKDHIVVYSDELERFGKENKYVAKNNVKVKLEKQDAVIYADQGIYELDDNQFIFIGNPYIQQKSTRYSANKIIYDTETKVIYLQGNSQITKRKKKIIADNIEYFSNHPQKKAVLKGNSKLIEYSANNSFLRGEVFREVKANRIVYYNIEDGKAILTGEPRYLEYFVEEEKQANKGIIKFVVYKREGIADQIKFFGGENERFALIGNVKVYEPYRAAFADRLDFFNNNPEAAVFRGNVVLYEFFNKNTTRYHYSQNKVKRKGTANLVKYFTKSKRIFLEGNAHTYEEDIEIKADIISYAAGETEKGYAKGNARFSREEEWAEADYIEFDNKQKKAILTGNAYYENEDIHAAADYIEHLDQEDKTVLKGNAKIYDDEKKAVGDKIVYTKKQGVEKAILTGSPKIYQKQKTVFANYIEYTKKDNQEVVLLDERAGYKEKRKHVFADQIIYYTIDVPEQEEKDEKIILKKHVRIIDSKRITIADNGEFYTSKKTNNKYEKGILTGDCEIHKKDGSQEAFSDVIEYYKDESAREKIVLKGSAEFTEKDRAGYADEMIIQPNYNQENVDKITLLGTPKVEDKNSYVVGEKIEILDGAKKQIRVYENGKYVNHQDDLEITGDYLFYDQDKEYVKAEKNPVFINKKDEFTVHAEVIESFRNEKISIASGDVKITQKKKIIYGEWAKYKEKRKKLEVTGDATLVENENVTRAKKIILYTKTKKIKLIGIKQGQIKTSK